MDHPDLTKLKPSSNQSLLKLINSDQELTKLKCFFNGVKFSSGWEQLYFTSNSWG